MSELPGWAEWKAGSEYTLGVEEEVMLLNPGNWSLAQQIDRVLPVLSDELRPHVTPETHRSALELGTGVHQTVASAAAELLHLRRTLAAALEPLELRCASSGTHPFTMWHETVLSGGDRYDTVYDSMRELARREPTFALHVHVGVPDPEDGIRLFNRMRAHLPVLLALSANSPFWQGRDSGLSSVRTSLFQAFPRVGTPRPFADYSEWVATVGLLVRSGAFPDDSYLWWDVRPRAPLRHGGGARHGRPDHRDRDRGAGGARAVHRAPGGHRGLRLTAAGGKHRGAVGEPLHRRARRHGG